MKPIKNKYFESKTFPNTFLRFVNKETGDYVDVNIPPASSENERVIFKDNPAFFAGYYNIFDEEKPKFDYYFLFHPNSENEYEGIMTFNVNGKLVRVNFDTDTNLPIMTDELKDFLKGEDIFDFINIENSDVWQ